MRRGATMNDQIADRLAGGREYIEKHGWDRGAWVHRNGKVCSIGGIVMSLDLSVRSVHSGPVEDAARVLLQAAGVPVHDWDTAVSVVTRWNDMPGRTEQEVLDTFAKAEKIARAGFDPDA
jgi:hypothetical protein